MSLRGARGIVRVSQNPDCEIQAAMVVDSAIQRGGRALRETDFYRLVLGHEYPGEYGERDAARRRGTAFEKNLVQNYAARLRQAVAPLYNLDPNTMTVRNFLDEAPGALYTMRLSKMRRLLRDLAEDRTVPDLLIQPQLRLKTGPKVGDYVHISPDFALLDRDAGIYVPGEIKSFIVRGNVADSADLEPTRRQAAVEVVALRAEAERAGLADRVSNRAAFVFATPFGLQPRSGHQEQLDGAVRDILRALQVIEQTKARLTAKRTVDDARFEVLIDELEPNYQESCIGKCVLTDYCKLREAGSARLLGDAAAEQLGANTDVDRIVEFLRGRPTSDGDEARVVADLADAIRALGYDPYTFRRSA